MSLLELTPPEKAQGRLAELYAESEQWFGAVPDNVRMLGVSPAVLENQFDFAKYFFCPRKPEHALSGNGSDAGLRYN